MGRPGSSEPSRALRAAWGADEPARRGPRPGLSIGAIAAVGVTIADGEGLDAVSMSRVAAELGYTPMSLYRYLTGKQELLELMVDHAAAGVDAAPPEGVSWREGLDALTRQLAAMLRSHPWIVDVAIAGPPVFPNQVAVMEHTLALLEPEGLEADECIGVLLLLNGFVRSWAGLFRDLEAAAAGGVGGDAGAALAGLVDAERFPRLVAAASSGLLSFGDDDVGGVDDFEFGLERLLDGVEVLIERRRPSTRLPSRGRGR